MVLSEAGAAGLPIVSTHVAAIPEIVRENQNGFLIAPGDLAGLTKSMRCLIEDDGLRIRMGEAGCKIVRQNYDAVHNTTRLLELIKKIVNQEHAALRMS